MSSPFILHGLNATEDTSKRGKGEVGTK